MRNQQRSKLIFWDIDGTLVHCGSDGRKALNRAFLQLFGVENAFDRLDIGGSMDSAILNGALDFYGIDQSERPRLEAAYAEALEDILEEDQTKCALPGVREVLEGISQTPGAFNALLTSNLRVGAARKLAAVGLRGYFRLGGFGDEEGEKWDAAFRGIQIAEAFWQTDFRFSDIWIVGDNSYDVDCARRVGCRCLCVATGWMSKEALAAAKPDVLLDDLSDVAGVLEILLS